MTSTIKLKMFPVNNEWLNCLSSYQYSSISLLNEKKTFGISCNYDFNIYIVQHEKISLLNNAFWKALSKNKNHILYNHITQKCGFSSFKEYMKKE